MNIRGFALTLSVALCSASGGLVGDEVGLLVMATGRYVEFVEPLIASAREHFCKNHHVTYFVFTDRELPACDDVVRIEQKRLGWPYDTMMRYEVYANAEELLSKQDYLFACDADMRFEDTVGDEILGTRAATLHPGFLWQRGSYERDPTSLAYVGPEEGEHYFAGGFYGGTSEEFLKITKTLSARINDDLARGFIAEWHDESHWNRYCIDYPPTVILTPSYCYPESCPASYRITGPKKLIALDKNHKEFQIPL